MRQPEQRQRRGQQPCVVERMPGGDHRAEERHRQVVQCSVVAPETGQKTFKKLDLSQVNSSFGEKVGSFLAQFVSVYSLC